MWRDKRQEKKACEHVSAAMEVFERIGATKELEKARVALRKLGE